MSTDLELSHELPKIQIPTIKTAATSSTSSTVSTPQDSKKPVFDEFDINNNEGECRTPTSKESRIPAILSCPPAPRKPNRRIIASSKRKPLNELQFFEILNRAEVDAFFRSSFGKRISSCSC